MIMLTSMLMNFSYIDRLFISSLSRLRLMLLYLLSCRCSISHSDTLQDKDLCSTNTRMKKKMIKILFHQNFNKSHSHQSCLDSFLHLLMLWSIIRSQIKLNTKSYWILWKDENFLLQRECFSNIQCVSRDEL
jgi:hypothetical protein